MDQSFVARLEALIATVPQEPCCFPGCTKRATTLASGRPNLTLGIVEALTGRAAGTLAVSSPLGCYCEDHAEKVADEGCPEHTSCCPACGCLSGVG